MPDPAQLKVGDRIHIVAVPKGDLRALEEGSKYLEETVRVLKWMVGREFVISRIDAGGLPWVDVDYPDPDGAEHFMAIADAESWERVEQ